MPEISRFFGIIIRMYYQDHAPPHFHAIYQNDSAEYHIFTLERLKGNLPPRAHAMVMEWAEINQIELQLDWDLAQRNEPVMTIKPLT